MMMARLEFDFPFVMEIITLQLLVEWIQRGAHFDPKDGGRVGWETTDNGWNR